MYPPDPYARNPLTRQSERAKVAKSGQQKQNRSVSVERQACFFVLLPIAVSVVLLAIAGSPR
jgi:hypothetical protein